MVATITLSSLERYLMDENIASAAITPGHLVEIVPSGGDAGQLRAHATAADTDVQVMFAVENELVGDDIDTAYADGDTVKFCYPVSGAKIYAWLEAAANVARGAPLESNGAGALQAKTTGQTVAYAEEAVDNSAGGSAVRIRVRAA
jgi:hypothetical protein